MPEAACRYRGLICLGFLARRDGFRILGGSGSAGDLVHSWWTPSRKKGPGSMVPFHHRLLQFKPSRAQPILDSRMGMALGAGAAL